MADGSGSSVSVSAEALVTRLEALGDAYTDLRSSVMEPTMKVHALLSKMV